MTLHNKINQQLQAYRRGLSDPMPEWPPKVQRALRIKQEHLYTAKLTVNWAKEQCRISGHNFSACFAHYTGMGPKEYINHHRIETAKQLLSNEELAGATISAIAQELGFAEPSTFSKCFKRETGLSPGRWRRGNS